MMIYLIVGEACHYPIKLLCGRWWWPSCRGRGTSLWGRCESLRPGSRSSRVRPWGRWPGSGRVPVSTWMTLRRVSTRIRSRRTGGARILTIRSWRRSSASILSWRTAVRRGHRLSTIGGSTGRGVGRSLGHRRGGGGQRVRDGDGAYRVSLVWFNLGQDGARLWRCNVGHGLVLGRFATVLLVLLVVLGRGWAGTARSCSP